MQYFRHVKHFNLEKLRDREALYFRSLATFKRGYNALFPERSDQGERRIIFIVGCQRSGTTLLTKIFERDLRTRIYNEFSELSNQDMQEGLRLNPAKALRAEFSRSNVPLIVAKPLVESQHVTRILQDFPNATALWLYRDYKDVAASNIKKWGVENGNRDIELVLSRNPANWRADKVSPEVLKKVETLMAGNRLPADPAALFWWVRNRFFFDQNLEAHDRVWLLNYKDLVSYPEQITRAIYRIVDRPFPGKKILKDVNVNSLGKGGQLELSEEVDQLCMETLDELNRVYPSKTLLPEHAGRAGKPVSFSK